MLDDLPGYLGGCNDPNERCPGLEVEYGNQVQTELPVYLSVYALTSPLRSCFEIVMHSHVSRSRTIFSIPVYPSLERRILIAIKARQFDLGLCRFLEDTCGRCSRCRRRLWSHERSIFCTKRSCEFGRHLSSSARVTVTCCTQQSCLHVLRLKSVGLLKVSYVAFPIMTSLRRLNVISRLEALNSLLASSYETL